MLRIFNDEFFSFNIITIDNTNENIVHQLMNVMVDPRSFELKQYKKTPFATFSTSMNTREFSREQVIITEETRKTGSAPSVPRYFLDTSFNQYSKYTDDTYDTILSKFDDACSHTLIFDTTHRNYTADEAKERVIHDDERKLAYLDKILLLIAMPIKGIVAPVKKSPNFKLYNGAFITCKLFPWNGSYYNKLVYYFVDMNTCFSFQEFVQTDNPEFGVMHNYYFSLNSDMEISMQKITSIIPYHNRENWFIKPEKNLFFLSDIPSDIINKQASISVPLSMAN